MRRLLKAGAARAHRHAPDRPVLVAATRANAVEAACELILAGADAIAKDAMADSAFLDAGAEWLNDILALTLEHGADVSSTNRHGGTALIPACERAHLETVKLLLATRIDVDHVNNLGWTCLLEAVILGDGGEAHQEVVRLLIEAGADLEIEDSEGTTALGHALRMQQGTVASLMQEAGARPWSRDHGTARVTVVVDTGNRPSAGLDHAPGAKYDEAMSKTPALRKLVTCSVLAVLLGLGACGIPHSGVPGSVAPATPPNSTLNPDAAAVLGQALIRAATVNDTVEVSRLLEAGAPLEYRGEDARTALLAATRANAIEAARELMEHGANVNAKDELKDSSFLYAGAEGLTEILVLTLEHGADVRATNRNGGTALIPACQHAYVETVDILLDWDVDVNHVNDAGLTCLLAAVIHGDGSQPYQDVVEMVIDSDANRSIADPQGMTALEHARQLKQNSVVKLLESAGPPS